MTHSTDNSGSDNTDTAQKTDTGKKTDTGNKINWLSEFRGLFMMLVAVLAFHSTIAKPFYIPSTSMLPNLMVGDRLVVSKYPYGWSWVSASFHLLPRSDTRIWADNPEYGDVIIAVPPTRDEDYIKRVVALPGDRIAVKNGRIILNGTQVPRTIEPPIRLPNDPQQICADLPCLGYFDRYLVTLENGDMVYEVPAYRETLPNGASYLIIDHEQDPLDNFAEITIPEDHVFMMGDNRDHSADSRAASFVGGLGGPVPIANVGGRAEFITFSLDGTTGWNPLSWFSSLRGGRSWTTLRPPITEQTVAP